MIHRPPHGCQSLCMFEKSNTNTIRFLSGQLIDISHWVIAFHSSRLCSSRHPQNIYPSTSTWSPSFSLVCTKLLRLSPGLNMVSLRGSERGYFLSVFFQLDLSSMIKSPGLKKGPVIKYKGWVCRLRVT